MTAGRCILCSGTGKLKQSHVIPQFVYRGLQQSAVAAHPLLCGACEDRLAIWESRFAREVFHPWVAGRVVAVKYGPWLLKFATSVCWRVLEKARRENHPGQVQADDCLKTWSEFLCGRRPDVGAFHVHLVRTDASPSRGIRSAIASDGAHARVHVTLGPISLHGLLCGTPRDEWSGTRINLEGKLKPRPTVMPAALRSIGGSAR